MKTLNIPDIGLPRIIILGAGFAGLKLAKSIDKTKFQVVLIDKNNFHQFQPLFYQVGMAGLEPSSISFPLRKAFQKEKNVHIRFAEFLRVIPEAKTIETSEGSCTYEYLVFAMGATTNFYNNPNFEKNSMGMKTVGEALAIRNQILQDFETALLTPDYEERQPFIDIVIVGGGATGVELAGALAEMKQYILPKDYKELNYKEVDIYLVDSGNALLSGMSEKSSLAAEKFLVSLGVHVIKETRVIKIDGSDVLLSSGASLRAKKVIWAAGIIANKVPGLSENAIGPGGRLKTNGQHQVEGYEEIYAIGDQAVIASTEKPFGDPQVAQVALQQAKNLAKNLSHKASKNFKYKDRGSMATIGRNKAVVDLPGFHFHGFFAWIVWLFVHLFALIGVKNKLFVFLNWIFNYMTYDQSLRLIIKSKVTKDDQKQDFIEK